MTDLTEQWKKGELPAGRYWVKYRSGRIDDWDLLGGKTIETKPEIVEVLAKVPSYEELQNMNKAVNECMAANIKLVEQNTQLKERVSKLEKMQYSYTPEEWNTMLRTVNRTKELLKECRNSLEEQSNVRKLYESDVEYRDRYNKKMDLLIKLDEVLK